MDNEKIEIFEEYLNLIIKWNKYVSLVSKADEDNLIEKHLIDSIIGCNEIKEAIDEKIIDLGSGNGFPAIPMKILYEKANISMIEINQKKASFLREAVRTLNLKNINIINLDINNFDFSQIERIIARAFKKIDEIERILSRKMFCGKISIWEKRENKRVRTYDFCNVENL